MTEKQIRLATLGVIISNDEKGNDSIQKIDNPLSFATEMELEYVAELESDADAVDIVRELVIDNYLETLKQDILKGDFSLLDACVRGEGFTPILQLNEQELIKEAIELNIIEL